MAKITLPVALTGEAAAHLVARQALEMMAVRVLMWRQDREDERFVFDDNECEIDFAVELFGVEIDRMRADSPPLERFCYLWFRAGSVIRLARQGYRHKGDHFSKLLEQMERQIDAIPELVDVVVNEHRRAPIPGGTA